MALKSKVNVLFLQVCVFIPKKKVCLSGILSVLCLLVSLSEKLQGVSISILQHIDLYRYFFTPFCHNLQCDLVQLWKVNLEIRHIWGTFLFLVQRQRKYILQRNKTKKAPGVFAINWINYKNKIKQCKTKHKAGFVKTVKKIGEITAIWNATNTSKNRLFHQKLNNQ